MTPLRSAILLLSALLLLPAQAGAGASEEAARQVELAEQDLAAGIFERAAASAASALRLDPGRTDAFVVRALALKGMGRLEDAAALLRTYRDLRGSLPVDERVEPALAEIERLPVPPQEPGPAGPGDVLPGVAGRQVSLAREWTALLPRSCAIPVPPRPRSG